MGAHVLRRVLKTAIAGLVLLILFSGCAGFTSTFRGGTGIEGAAGTSGDRLAGSEAARRVEKLPPFQNDYSRDGFIRSLVQLGVLRESSDHFSAYIWGDVVFEDYLATIIWLEEKPVFSGRGVEMTFYDESGYPYHRLTRGWVSIPGRSGSVWKMSHAAGELDFTCEVISTEEGVPGTIYVQGTGSGGTIKRNAFYSEMLEQQDKDWFSEIREAEYEARRTRVYEAMDVDGEEAVLIAGRWMRAVKMSSSPNMSRDTLVGWFSPDVSGRVLKLARGDGSLIAELTAFRESYETELYRP